MAWNYGGTGPRGYDDDDGVLSNVLGDISSAVQGEMLYKCEGGFEGKCEGYTEVSEIDEKGEPLYLSFGNYLIICKFSDVNVVHCFSSEQSRHRFYMEHPKEMSDLVPAIAMKDVMGNISIGCRDCYGANGKPCPSHSFSVDDKYWFQDLSDEIA